MAESKNSAPMWPAWTRGLVFGLGLLVVFVVRVGLEWPMVLDFRNFAFRDAGSFEYVNHLLDMGLKPSVDFGFSYGLLGVMVQRLIFSVFGAGLSTTLAFAGVYLALILIFWWLLARDLRFSWWSFAILLGLYGMVVGLEQSIPTTTHLVVRVLLVYSLWFAMKARLRLALVLAGLAALALPSLPIILAALLSVTIVWQWWKTPQRRLLNLAAQFAPAIGVYILGVLLFVVVFGWRTVLPSLLPMQGVAVYRAMNFGFFANYGLYSGRSFWLPQDASFAYYLYNKAGIWLFCTVLLVVFGVVSVSRIIHSRKASGIPFFIFLCCALHLFFIIFAFGSAASSVYYEYILVAGVVAGVGGLTKGRLRAVLSCLILVIGLLSNRYDVSNQRAAWRTWHRSAETAGLYAPDSFRPEWAPILKLADNHDLLLLAYGTGVSRYFPQVKTARSWFLLPGNVLPAEDAYVLDQIQKSDVVVEYIAAPRLYIDENIGWQAALAHFPVRLKGNYFRIWTRNKAEGDLLARTMVYRPEEVNIDLDKPQ